MDALTAALVVAALAQLGDRTAWLAAILADRFGAAAVVAGAVLALGANYALAAAAGTAVAPVLTPEAKLLLLALSLLIAGGGMAFAPRRPDPLAGWRIGAFPTALAGLFVMAFGDAAQFVAAALAARSSVPWLAAAGATLGSLALVVPAAALGEGGWRRLPLAPLRWGAGGLLLLAGAVLAMTALGLV